MAQKNTALCGSSPFIILYSCIIKITHPIFHAHLFIKEVLFSNNDWHYVHETCIDYDLSFFLVWCAGLLWELHRHRIRCSLSTVSHPQLPPGQQVKHTHLHTSLSVLYTQRLWFMTSNVLESTLLKNKGGVPQRTFQWRRTFE